MGGGFCQLMFSCTSTEDPAGVCVLCSRKCLHVCVPRGRGKGASRVHAVWGCSFLQSPSVMYGMCGQVNKRPVTGNGGGSSEDPWVVSSLKIKLSSTTKTLEATDERRRRAWGGGHSTGRTTQKMLSLKGMSGRSGPFLRADARVEGQLWLVGPPRGWLTESCASDSTAP